MNRRIDGFDPPTAPLITLWRFLCSTSEQLAGFVEQAPYFAPPLSREPEFHAVVAHPCRPEAPGQRGKKRRMFSGHEAAGQAMPLFGLAVGERIEEGNPKEGTAAARTDGGLSSRFDNHRAGV
jgi:hypothetical protein